MSLYIHGQNIEANQVELGLSTEGAEVFANLCNSIVWAQTEGLVFSVPSFTERVNAADGGIDGEWSVDEDKDIHSSALYGCGWNVYQYKQRDVLNGRGSAYSTLKSSVKGAVQELFKNFRRRPTRYVIFTNVDLLHEHKTTLSAPPKRKQKGKEEKTSPPDTDDAADEAVKDKKTAIREAALEDYDAPNTVHVEIIGAAELAAFLNHLPYLRSAYFARTQFSSWKTMSDNHKSEMLGGAPSELVGRQSEIVTLKAWIDDPDVRTIVLAGPSGVGKSRLMLDATEHKRATTVIARNPDVSINEVLALRGRMGVTVIAVVDDPTPSKAKWLAKEVLTEPQIKLVITLPTEERAALPNFVPDRRVKVLTLAGLDSPQSYELLRKVNANLDYGVQSYVVQRSGGLPRILLLAAQFGDDLRPQLDNFFLDISRKMEDRVREAVGDAKVEVLKLLSLMVRVKLDDNFGELKALISVFGKETVPDVNTVVDAVRRLDNTGFTRSGGSFVEVIPPFLAVHFATVALRGRFIQLLEIFARLEGSARGRLVERLCQTKVPEVTQFINALFESDGLLTDVDQALDNLNLLSHVSAADPKRTIGMFLTGLASKTWTQRHEIGGKRRHGLLEAIQQLLSREISGADALRCLGLLAEAESDPAHSDNATRLFLEAFQALNPMVPVLFQDRINVLTELVERVDQTQGAKLLAVRAIETAFHHDNLYALRDNLGPSPFDTKSEWTRLEVSDYADGLFDLLLSFDGSDDQEISKAASKAIVASLHGYATLTHPNDTLSRLSKLVDASIGETLQVSASRLLDEFQSVRDLWEARQVRTDSASTVQVWREAIQQLDTLSERVEVGTFATRLKIWASDWSKKDNIEVAVRQDGTAITKGDQELEKLASELVSSPDYLTDDVLTWLSSPKESHKGRLFLTLAGCRDSEKRLLAILESHLNEETASLGIAFYFRGLQDIDPVLVQREVYRLWRERLFSPVTAFLILSHMDADNDNTIFLGQIFEGELPNKDSLILELGHSRWVRTATPPQCLHVLQIAAGDQLQRSSYVVSVLANRLDEKETLDDQLIEFAWQCLITAHPSEDIDSYSFNKVAQLAASVNPENAFSAFETLLHKQEDLVKGWLPLDAYNDKGLWFELRKIDHLRAVRTILDAALDDAQLRFRLCLTHRHVINQIDDYDILTRFSEAAEPKAELVAMLISPTQPGFWPIAAFLLEQYPKNAEVSRQLEGHIRGIPYSSDGFVPLDQFADDAPNIIRAVLKEQTFSNGVRRWLRGLETRIRSESAQPLIDRRLDKALHQDHNTSENDDAKQTAWAQNLVERTRDNND